MLITKEQFNKALQQTTNFDTVAEGIATGFVFVYDDKTSAYQVDTKEFEGVEYRPLTGSYHGVM